jgi:putative zinc finger/helix-turn-helix YgiT family protein
MGDKPMTMTVNKFCDSCQTDVEAKIIERLSTFTFKGETFTITERVLQCDCNHELYDEILDTETMKTLTKLYEERQGLSLEEIKNVRKQYNLSQDLFARILGWSKSTIARYETGKFIPDSSHMFILKSLKENPDKIDDYYKVSQHKFTEPEQLKISEKLKMNDQINVEKELNHALQLNYKLHEKTMDAGFRTFELEKIINMIKFFSEKGVQKTKLMKLLFYSDFLFYKRNLLSMSGVPYMRLPFGPVPKDHDLLLSSIEKNEIIDINYEFVNDYTLINIKSKQEFDESYFTDEELEVLNHVRKFFEGYGSVAISDFSHKEEGWKNTDDREIISYDYAGTLQID